MRISEWFAVIAAADEHSVSPGADQGTRREGKGQGGIPQASERKAFSRPYPVTVRSGNRW
jgi:hypothetical protein